MNSSKIELILTGGIPYEYSGNTNATAAGVVDLFGNEPIQLNISCADIKDIKKRKATFSQSFVVPGTANNNTLFNHIYEIGSDSQFDPRKKTPCQLLVDTIPVITTGNLQLTGIIVDDAKNISYEVTIFDETEDLVDALGSLELSDLDYTDLNHIWNYQNIIDSWTGSSQPYFYPLIDYGYDFNMIDINDTSNFKKGVEVGDMYPAIQAKVIWDRIFSGATYEYSSAFINSEYFKNLYIPYNGNAEVVLAPETVQDLSFAAQHTGTTSFTVPVQNGFFTGGGQGGPPVYHYVDNYFLSTYQYIGFTNDFNVPFFDNGGHYNNATGRYLSTAVLNQQFKVDLVFDITKTLNPPFQGITNFDVKTVSIMVDFFRTSWNSGTIPYETVSWVVNNPTSFGSTIYNTFAGSVLNKPPASGVGPTQVGEEFFVGIRYLVSYHSGIGGSVTINIRPTGTNGGKTVYSVFYNTPASTVSAGSLIQYNSLIPKKIKQIDFLNSIITMHNLYVITDQDNPKKLLIEPRDDYYASGTTKDWSAKLDLSQKVHEQLLSEQQNNRIVFTYKNDKDYYNTDYNRVTNRIFGDEYVNINNDFTKDDQVIDIIFSPTPNVAVLESAAKLIPGLSAATVDDFVIPKIGKVDSNGNFGRADFNIRILQKNPSNTLPLANGETWHLDGNSFNRYPYLGMLNHPFSGDTDISFGTVEYEYYILNTITTNNLVNHYYRRYLDQIIDKDGKLITAQFYLTPEDIQKFKFNDIIFVDGLSNRTMGDYFLVNSIKYTPTTNGTSEVELIQLPHKQVDVIYKPIRNKRTNPFNVISWGGAFVNSTLNVGIGSVSIGVNSWGVIGLGKVLNIGSTGHNGILVGSGTTVGNNLWNVTAIGDGNVIGINPFNMNITGNYNIVGDVNTNTFVVGDFNTVTGNTINTSILGANNYIDVGAISSTVNGNNNFIGYSATSSTVFGNNNYIGGSGSTSFIAGDYNQINSGLTNVYIFSNFTTATTSNTIYTDNIQMSSGSTINGVPISAITVGSTLWTTGSTGNFSLKTVNNTALDATGDYSVAEGDFTHATGTTSHAEGAQTTAGDYSHAEGINTRANNVSHSEGQGTTATGNASHAEGDSSQALADQSHAEGSGSLANGNSSHAEGGSTTASGAASHSEGTQTTASGQYSHSEGEFTIASGIDSHAEGSGTTASGSASHASGLDTKALGIASHTEGIATTATTFGDYGHAEGSGTTSDGFAAHAEGNGTLAFGDYSHAEGVITTAQGQATHVEGYQTTAIADYSHAEGYQTTVTSFGKHGHTEGYLTTAFNEGAHAEGGTVTNGIKGGSAFGLGSHAEGLQTTAGGDGSHAEGYLTTASQNESHAEGKQTTSSGNFAHSEGLLTTASGSASHAEGQSTVASGQTAHVEGHSNIAGGSFSHAGGSGSTASGNHSFVHGSGSTASGIGTVVLGDNITGATNNTTYVAKLNIGTLNNTSSVNNLGIDANGFVVTASTSSITITGSTYTPTLTNVTNVTSSTAANCQFNRVGNIVTVFGSLAIVTTLAVATEVDISLPIASNIGATTDINGLGQASSAIATNAYIDGDATNDRARLNFIGLSVGGSGNIFFTFSYTII